MKNFLLFSMYFIVKIVNFDKSAIVKHYLYIFTTFYTVQYVNCAVDSKDNV